MMRSNSI